jgi:hypothetical protein
MARKHKIGTQRFDSALSLARFAVASMEQPSESNEG